MLQHLLRVPLTCLATLLFCWGVSAQCEDPIEFNANLSNSTVQCVSDLPTECDVTVTANRGATACILGEQRSAFNSCNGTTAEGTGEDGAIVLFDVDGDPNDDRYFVPTDEGITLTQFENGVAQVTGQVHQTGNENAILNVNIVYDQGVGGADWDGGFKHAQNCAVTTDITDSWTIYILNPGLSYLTGEGDLDGTLLTLNHAPSSEYFGFQVGEMANDRNCNDGAGGWFSYEGQINGQAIQGAQGDVLLDIDCNSGSVDPCAEDGPSVTLIYTSIDVACGDALTVEQVISRDDTTDPTFDNAPADVTVACADGEPAVATVTASDNCEADDGEPVVTYQGQSEQYDVACTGSYKVDRTWTAEDCSGNMIAHTQTITVVDLVAPTISGGEDYTAECDGQGNATELANFLATQGGATAMDDCGTVSWSHDYEDGDLSDGCGETGTVDVIFTASDDCGNQSTIELTFTIEDTGAPTLTADAMVEVDCALYDATAVYGASATDLCGDAEVVLVSVSEVSSSCAGSFIHTYKAVDDCNNESATYDQVVNLIDSEAPAVTISCPADADLIADENCAADVSTTALGMATFTATDNCDDELDTDLTHSDVQVDGCEGSYTITRTWTITATDHCNLTSSTSCDQIITVSDETNPTIDVAAANQTVECDGAGNTAALNAWLADNGGAEASDNCTAELTWTNDFDGLSDLCGATGSATVIFTATDDCGNATSTTATFTIEDTTAPTIASAAMDMTVECDGSGNEAELAAWLASNGGAGEATDVCSDPVVTSLALSASSLIDAGPNGTWPHVVTLTTNADPTSGSQQTLEINVTSLPDGGANYRVVKTVANGNWFQANPQPLSLGMNTITVSGVSFQRSVKVQFSDGDVEFDALAINGEEQMSATLSTGTSDLFAPGPNATWTHVYTATTAADPNSGDQQTVEINVTSLPSGGANYRVAKTVANGNWFFGNAQALSLGSNTITVSGVAFQRSVKIQMSSGDIQFDSLILNGAEQITGGVTWSNDFTALSDDCGATGSATVTFTATDACGNTSSTTATFTIEDTTAPTFTVPADVTVDCSADTAPASTGDVLDAGDACGDVTVSYSDVVTDGSFSLDGLTADIRVELRLNNLVAFPRVLEATQVTIGDGMELTVDDEVSNPLNLRGALGVDLSDDMVNLVVQDVITSESYDYVEVRISNLDGAGVVGAEMVFDAILVDPASAEFDLSFSGDEIVMSWTELPGSTLAINDGGTAAATALGAANCISQNVITRTWTATDACGNSASMNQVITQEDMTAPVFDFAPADVTLDCTESYTLEMATATDACSGATVSYTDSESFPCEGSRVVERTFTATDGCGNSSEHIQTISYLDTTAPAFTVMPEDFGLECSEALPVTVAEAADDCGSVSLTYADETVEGDCSGNYTVVRTFTAQDGCGNSSTHVQNIVFTDTTAPVVLTFPADAAYQVVAGEAIPVEFPIAEDACGQVNITFADLCTDMAIGGFNAVRTFTITDDCGNTTEVAQNISVTFATGCDDPTALNYDPTALAGDGSCQYAGCTNPGALNFNPLADVDDGSCLVADIEGCMDPSACNYFEAANVDDGSCDYCSCVNAPVIDGYSIELETVAVNGVPGTTTYRLYATMVNPTDVLSSVVGEAGFETNINTSTTFYQDPFGGALGQVVNPILFSIQPALEYDSYVTIGLAQGADPAAGEIEVTAVESDGANWVGPFEDGGDINIGGAFGGAWFTLNGASNALAGDDLQVLLGQFTTSGTLSGQISLQIFPEGDGENDLVMTFPIGNPGCGCTDLEACNFVDGANYDDGSCAYTDIYDCDAETCMNDADGDGVCDELEVAGCTQASALNFMAAATDDDGSCLFLGCMDETADNYDTNANVAGFCAYPTEGCTDAAAANYSADALVDDGSCLYPGCTDETALNYDPTANFDSGCILQLEGCTDPMAENFNPLANTNDGSCEYTPPCPGDLNGDGTININDLLDFFQIYGSDCAE